MEQELEEDAELLARFIRTGAERAFVTLMRRHSGGVYRTALRIVRSPLMAEDVAQVVFIELVQRPPHPRRDLVLAAWLHRVTRSRAIDALRQESRRRHREQVAVLLEEEAIRSVPSEVEGLLDEAIASLGEKDRAAVFLRFFERKSLSEVGSSLGVSADAAQKRVERSVEHLRRFYVRRGHPVGISSLSAALAAISATAAPSRLYSSIQATVKTATVTSVGPSGLFSTLVMSLGTKIVIPAFVILSAVAGFLLHGSHGETWSDDPNRNPLANSGSRAGADNRSRPLGGNVTIKAFRPRLDEAGKRNLAQDPAGILTAHYRESEWSGADDDLLVAWAAKDPQAAAAWVSSGEHNPVILAQLLGAVGAGLLLRDGPEAARRFLAENKGVGEISPMDQDALETSMFGYLGREDSIGLALQMLDADKAENEAANPTDMIGEDEDAALERKAREARSGLNAGSLVGGIQNFRDIADAIDYLEAKGYSVYLDYWDFQGVFEKESEFWSDWALQRNSDSMCDILQSWARDHEDDARAWIEKNLPKDDDRRKEIEELLEPVASTDWQENLDGAADNEMEDEGDE